MSDDKTIDLRLGRWQDALADVSEFDSIVTDPPYSERTHRGHDDGSELANRTGVDATRRTIAYKSWTEADVHEFVSALSTRTRGWFVALTDHVLAPAWEKAFEASDRYTFAPLHFIHPGSRVRIAGDGPAIWSVTIVVSRPRTKEFSKWGSLPGGYILPPGVENRLGQAVAGAKPLWLMRALVRDYTRPGDLVCDPCAGGATTLLAAAMEGRRAIGSEMDPKTYALAKKRLAKGWTPPLFVDAPRESANDQQLDLLGKAE